MDSLLISQVAARRALEEYIFGEGSALLMSDSAVETQQVEPLMSNLPYYEVAVVVCLTLYIIWVMRFVTFSLGSAKGGSSLLGGGGEVASDTMFGGKSSAGVDEKSGVSDKVLAWCLLIGLSVILSTRVVDWISGSEYLGYFAPFNISREVIEFGFERWCLGVVVGFLGSLLWGAVVLFLAGRVTRNEQLLVGVMRFKSQMILLSVVWLLPVVLLSSFESDDSIMVYLTGLELVVLSVIYLFRSFLLFTAQKISILQWFLYLCTVEVLPITFVWAIFTRSVSV